MCEQRTAPAHFVIAGTLDAEPALRDGDVELFLLVTARLNPMKPKGAIGMNFNYSKDNH